MSELLDMPELVRGLTSEGRELLAKRLVRHRVPKGQTVVERGTTVSGAYVVLSGRLRVFAYGPSGQEATLYLIAPGETCVLALNSLFNDLLYPAWVQAEEDTTIGIIPGPVFRTLFERERSIQDLTVRALSTVVFRLMGELEQIHSCTLDRRLANFLLLHASGEGIVNKTQQEIGAHIGTSREVIARLMGIFASRGYVETTRGRVKLCNTSALTILAKGEYADDEDIFHQREMKSSSSMNGSLFG